MTEFFQMGGYAWYVWPAYLVTAVVLIGNLIVSRYRLKQVKQKLLGKYERERKISS